MNANTKNAINRRLANGETMFYIGKYFYEYSVNGIFRRREQVPGYAPTSDWERLPDPVNVD